MQQHLPFPSVDGQRGVQAPRPAPIANCVRRDAKTCNGVCGLAARGKSHELDSDIALLITSQPHSKLGLAKGVRHGTCRLDCELQEDLIENGLTRECNVVVDAYKNDILPMPARLRVARPVPSLGDP